jgi:hypothetical protein
MIRSMARPTAVAKREDERLVKWRFEELRRAGYDDRAAAFLARHVEIDLHRALDLIGQGCPTSTALRILL